MIKNKQTEDALAVASALIHVQTAQYRINTVSGKTDK